MKTTRYLSVLAAAGLMALPIADAGLRLGLFQDSTAFAADREGQRPPPQARSAGTLSQNVSNIIFRVMEMRDMDNIAGAVQELGRVREMHDRGRLNEFETYTMWQFYANLAYLQEDMQGALDYYGRMVQVPNLTPERLEQGWFMIAQLHFVLEQWQEALNAYDRYLQIAAAPDADVYLRMAQAYYQMERYAEAVPLVRQNMDMVRAAGRDVPDSTYELLRALYLTQEDYQNARQATREMVVLFNKPQDWGYLGAIEGQLERFEDQAHTFYVANEGGYLTEQSQLVNLAAQMSQNDNPYGGAMVMEEGIRAGIVQESEDNLSLLSQFYQIAREDEKALVPLERVADMTGKGEYYARMGRILMTLGRFDDAVEAFNEGLRAGGVDRVDQVQLALARCYWELNQYDNGLAAARRAASDERSRDTAQTFVTILTREQERYNALQQNRELYKDYFIR